MQGREHSLSSLSDSRVVGVVCVVVIRPVLLILRIESGHAQRSPQLLCVDFQCLQGVLGIEKLGCDGHGDRKVTPKLVVGKRMGRAGAEDVLVDASASNEFGFEKIRCVLLRVCKPFSATKLRSKGADLLAHRMPFQRTA